MNDNSIVSYGELNPENLKRLDYTNTLTAEAVRVGLMTEAGLDSLRVDLMSALAEIVGLYTQNESTSVKADTARELTASMLYNIDTYLLSLKNHKQAITQLRERKAYELYGKGYLINKALFEKAKHLYGAARLSRLKNAGEAYNKTLDQYFHYYLTHYDPRFSAHLKVYLTLTEYKISGAFHINRAVDVLKRIIEINRGPKADITISAEKDPGTPSEEE